MPQQNANGNNYTYPQKLWIAGGIFALIIIVLLLIKATFSVFLLILAGTLIAVFFHGFSNLIHRKLNFKQSLSLALAVIITILFITGISWLIGAKVQSQIAQLTETLPSTIENAKTQINKNPIGQKIIENVSSPASQAKAKAMASTFFKSTFGVLGDMYVILFIGIFFTVSPRLYKNGLVKMVPPRGREKAKDIVERLGTNLQKWLKGKLFAMLVVFILTAIGLVVLGIPMWLALALVAGMLNFIPNFGPILAMIPAVLVALLIGPATAGLVAGLYILIQVIESNFITPLVQNKLINIPPALIIIAQLLVGTISGGWGIILATPLMLIVMILVKELYLKRMENENG